MHSISIQNPILKFLIVMLCFLCAKAYGTLVGGRPNAFSEGQNAFAGVVNPANAVWIADRFDVGAFWVHQKSSLNNLDNNPLFPRSKLNLNYKAQSIFTVDAAIHKQVKLHFCSQDFDGSISLATYTLPAYTKLRTKEPIPIAGTTPIKILQKTETISVVFSLKLNTAHSVGLSLDYAHFSELRNGFQNSDNFLRSVSPGHVTNNGTDYSDGIGLNIGWRWKITENLNFGAAWSRKSYCGQFRKYRGFEPHHAENYLPQTIGAGFSYRSPFKLAGHLELLWVNLGNLPASNSNVLPDGSLNLNKRGSKKSPGPGLQDATYINVGVGYPLNELLSVGAGLSHRIKLHRSSNILSHTYRLQAIYDILSLGANLNYQKHNLFLSFAYGFKNLTSGFMPVELDGGRFIGEKQAVYLSVSWGYKY